jgi:hypothetical protein
MKVLARLLKIPLPYANGLALRLWAKTAAFKPDGAIGECSNVEIAEHLAVPIDFDPDALVDALIQARFIDKVESPKRLIVHDWADHCNDFTHKKLARKLAFFADGQAPRLTRLLASERAKAEAFYATGAQKPVLGAQKPVLGAQKPVLGAQRDNSSSPKPLVTGAQKPVLGAQTGHTARAGPTPTPTPTPTPLEVLPKVQVHTDLSSSSSGGLMMNGAWKLTEAAIHARFPSVNGNFWPRFLGKCGEQYRKQARPKCGDFSDLLVSEAVEQANRESPNQESAGLYLQTVPSIIATWARDGVTVSSTNKKAGFVDGVKKLARKKLERDGQI